MLRRLHILKDLTDLTQPAVEDILAKAPPKSKTAKNRSDGAGSGLSSASKGKKISVDATVSSRGTSTNGAVVNGEYVEPSSSSHPTNFPLKGKKK